VRLLGRLLRTIFLLGFCLAVALGGLGYYLNRWSSSPVTIVPETGVVVSFPKGTPLGRLGERLAEQGVINNRWLFTLLVRADGQYGSFQAGDYQFMGMVTPREVVQKILKGETFSEVVLQFTIPEGFNVQQVSERLSAQGLGSVAEIKALLHDPKFLKQMRVEGQSLEGFLYPATYTFHKKPLLRDVVQKMVETFWQRLPNGYMDELKKVGLTLNQAVTFASLIELETQLDSERPKVAEVIWRRLKDGVPIAIDAALIYGIKDYKGDITWAHLKDAANPYNTRIHRGLPPGPIGAPSANSLLAVLNPSKEGFYYYVLTEYGSKEHAFSKSLSEHNQRVKLFMESNPKK